MKKTTGEKLSERSNNAQPSATAETAPLRDRAQVRVAEKNQAAERMGKMDSTGVRVERSGMNRPGFVKVAVAMCAIVLAGVFSSCSGTPTDTAANTDEKARICPKNLVIQTDWWPELEHVGSYQLIGPNGTADRETFRYSGPIQPQYQVGGIETVEVRAGGDATGFSPVTSLLYEDEDITLGYVNTSDALKDAATNRVIGVAKTIEIHPHMIMWDPAQHTVESPQDLAKTGATMLYFDGNAVVDFLVSEGALTEEQLDPSYGGAPDRFIESNGAILQQGFASNEVHKYENEIDWKDGAPGPVRFYLVHDLGFEDYPAMYSIRSDRMEELSGCLELLVPKLSQAWVDVLADPSEMGNKLVEINETYDTYWKLSPQLNARASEMFDRGLAINGGDQVDYCSFSTPRVQALAEIMEKVIEDRGGLIAEDYSAELIMTNKFCDETIKR